MTLRSACHYSEWRQRTHPLAVLQEEDIPSERLLQAIWHHQRIRREDLRLFDGSALSILHPGFWNHGAGPDFRSAVLQFEDEPAVCGDIEIDLEPHGWRGHAHDHNPAFRNVRLHVIWDGEPRTNLPTLALKPYLDAPIAQLGLWLCTETARRYPEQLLGKCASPLRDLSTEQLEQLLAEAALVRLERKASDLHARARQAGWEQALWEGLLRGLGYKQNVWPMQRIGELRSRLCHQVHDTIDLQARLLGISGLLPPDVSRSRCDTDAFLLEVWNRWWRERDAFADCALPRPVWRLNALRPANHPQRRLAAAAHWWVDAKLIPRLERWFTGAVDTPELPSSLTRALQPGEDLFWSRHWTLRSARFDHRQPLIGTTRMTDLAINVVLPWLWVRAREGGNATLQVEAERRYFSWPAAEDNSVLRLARNRLLGGRERTRLRTAAMQQGLMQIGRDFCDHSNALCVDCRFPELVGNWKLAPV